MRRIVAVLLTLIPWLATAAGHADPLFDFKLSGDGHTFEFLLPNPAPVYDHPHNIQVQLSNAPGTEDGAAGYLFDLDLTVVSRAFLASNFSLYVVSPNGGTAFQYDLAGPSIASTSFVPVSYNPIYSGPGYQNLIYSSFVPDNYVFHGLLGQSLETFDLSITEQDDPLATPEPATWMLLATGAAGAVAFGRRRGIAAGRVRAG